MKTIHALIRDLTLSAVTLACFACTVSTSTSPSSSPPTAGAASSAEVDSCKHEACDKMKFFGCNSADEQAACYADCDKATTSQIDLFRACAASSVCDPACRTNIAPAPAAGSSGGSGGGSGGGGGASASSCSSACDKLVQCSLIPVGAKDQCVSQCQTAAYQYQIDCVNSTACNAIKATCGDPTAGTGGGGGGGAIDSGLDDSFSIQKCQTACDTLSFYSCISAADHQKCRDDCTTAAGNKRDGLSSCVNASAPECAKAADCYSVFEQ